MALDRQFFDSVRTDAANRKFYDAAQVRSLMYNIEKQVNALQAENTELHARLDSATPAEDFSDIDLLSQKIIEKARSDADEIIAAAEARRDEILSCQQQTMVDTVRSCMDALRQQQMDNIELINNAWQDFLCSLETGNIPSVAESSPAVPVEQAATSPKSPSLRREEPNMYELQRRVASIADELRQIGNNR